MATVSVSRLKESGFYLAREMVTNHQELVDVLNYVDFLAGLNAVNADSLELPIDGNEFKLSKSEVTKLFFGHIEEKKEVVSVPVIPLPADVVKAVTDMVTASKGRSRDHQMQSIVTLRRDATISMNLALEKLHAARIRQLEIEALQDADPAKVVQDILDGLPGTNWNFHRYDSYNKRLEFVSRSDIILSHHNQSAGLKYDLNCGKFIARFRLTDCRISVEGYQGHVDSAYDDGSNIHPHASGGTVCFGNAAHTAADAIASGNILKLLQILDALFPNYGDAPYVSINTFSTFIKKRDERLRREREQKDKAPEAPSGEFGDQDFADQADFDELQFDYEDEGDSDVASEE